MEDEVIKKLNKFFIQFRSIHYAKGEIILRAEDTPQGVSYLKSGYVRLYSVSEEGKELTLNIYKPGSYFPMTWAIGDMPNVYFFEAMTETEVLRAPKEKVVEFLKEEPEVLYEFTRRIVIGLEGMLTRIQYLLYGNAQTKISSTVLLLAKRFGEQKKEGVKIFLPFTHSDIASLAGLTRETTSLEMEKLKKERLINYQRKIIIVKDVDKLREKSLLFFDEEPLPYTF